MSLRVLLFVTLALVVSIYAAPPEPELLSRNPLTNPCPVICTSDSDCCNPGGCYLAACTVCRIVGVTCGVDSHCCDRGGCYLNKCVACRAFGVTCQTHNQCCNGNCSPTFHRCT